ncbi:MAG: sugar transferase [Chitinophagaceae bacterium]|nr:sugar transferase [Chitinophagaceae bacterium]
MTVKTIPQLLQTEYTTELSHPITTEALTIAENAIIAPFVANRKNYLYLKRTVDIVVSLLVIVLVLSWLLPIVAIWIRLDSRGPVFFSQKRVGRDGKLFRCLKLRTMRINEDADEKPAEENDSRITRAGRFLRKTNIDELPQFLNVLVGHMSLTGPRPHMLSDCNRFSFVISSYRFRNLVKPGITGLAQIKGYHGPAGDYEGIVNRYYWDAVYVRKANMRLDLKILGRTVVISGRTLVRAVWK